MNDFDSDFDGLLDGLGETFGAGKSFVFNGQSYPVVDIGPLDTKYSAALGPVFKDVTQTLTIRKAVAAESGVKRTDTIEINGQRLKVLGTLDEGDDSVVLALGSPTVNLRSL